MHMRTKKWAKPELNACAYYTDKPEELAGHWSERFARKQPLHVELGCGKGVSTALMIRDHPEINYIAIDIADNVLGDTRRNIQKAVGDRDVQNTVIAKKDIEYIREVFTSEDQIERIYIFFCNPWTKRGRYEKRRLTHPRQLLQYRHFLADHGQIHFKTDNDELFKDTLIYLEKCGFSITYITYDLHTSGYEPNYMTEHEKMFSQQGIPIKFLIAEKMDGDFDFDATRWNIDRHLQDEGNGKDEKNDQK